MAAVGDVAQRAGVSTCTVPRVLNGVHFVSAELRARVHAAVVDLDYQPNAGARSLSLKSSNAIGAMVADMRNRSFASVSRGVEHVAQTHAYQLVRCNTDGDAIRESVHLHALQTRQVDSAPVASGGAAAAFLGRIRAGLPVVLVDRDVPAIVLDKTALVRATLAPRGWNRSRGSGV